MSIDLATAAHAYEGQHHFIGVITPSGNTVVERITLGVLRDLPTVSPHFSRTPVFGNKDPSPDAYAYEGLLAAAQLLTHAKPDVLVWNGSKGAGIGFAHDVALVSEIQAHTGITVTTSILGLQIALGVRGITRIAVVTPYSDAGQKGALDCLEREGYECVAEAHAGLSDNLSYASVPLDKIREMARSVMRAKPDAIVCLCTNFPAAVLAAPLETELGIPVFDSTALGVWSALHVCGADTSAAAPRWGSLFGMQP
jgi:maleate isomerase